MSAVCVLLKFLDQRLDCKTHLIENISPVVTALIRLVKSERVIRKYVRLQVRKEKFSFVSILLLAFSS